MNLILHQGICVYVQYYLVVWMCAHGKIVKLSYDHGERTQRTIFLHRNNNENENDYKK